MNSPEKQQSAAGFDARLTAALERKPEPRIPADFATRVAARAVVQPLRHTRTSPRFGRAVALLSVPLATLALFLLAPHAAPDLHNLSFDTELALLGELALIGWWMSHGFSSRLSR